MATFRSTTELLPLYKKNIINYLDNNKSNYFSKVLEKVIDLIKDTEKNRKLHYILPYHILPIVHVSVKNKSLYLNDDKVFITNNEIDDIDIRFNHNNTSPDIEYFNFNKKENNNLICGQKNYKNIDFIRKKYWVINTGDSRCICCINNKSKQISIDHKPSNSKESNRIYKMGTKK